LPHHARPKRGGESLHGKTRASVQGNVGGESKVIIPLRFQDGTNQYLTGRPRLWFTSISYRKDRLRYEHEPKAASHL
jgi:hypothetical protein